MLCNVVLCKLYANIPPTCHSYSDLDIPSYWTQVITGLGVITKISLIIFRSHNAEGCVLCPYQGKIRKQINF